jgi:hypothetical protein
MKLKKTDRERLYKAKGAMVEIIWPEDAPSPRNGKRYKVVNKDDEKLFSVRVERLKRSPYETKATVRVDDDPFLPMIGINGVRLEDGSYETEPERVDEKYEELLCEVNDYGSRLIRAEHRHEAKTVRKEQRVGSSSRAERAIARHSRSLAAKTSSVAGILPISPAGPADAVISSGG